MDSGTWTNIGLVLLFILVGGVFAGTEIALVSLRESQVARIAPHAARGARGAPGARDPNRFLAAVQIGVTVAGFFSAAYGASTLAPDLAPALEGLGLARGLAGLAAGQRLAGARQSAAPTVILGAVAARTSRILLSTGVTVLSLLDPIRVAEDLATVDQLSRGRLEIVIGKGNEVLQYPLLGLDLDKQYEYLQENYELLRLLLSEEDVSWSGRHRHALEHATTLPRPFAGPFRIWHGSATSRFAVDLAARYGDPIVSANALQPRENYQVLIDRFREQYAAHGHDPAYGFVGSGSGGLFLADTTEEAIEQSRPLYEGQVAAAARGGSGPAAVGTARRGRAGPWTRSGASCRGPGCARPAGRRCASRAAAPRRRRGRR